MRSAGAWGIVASLAIALAGCPKKPPMPDVGDDADTDADAPAAPTATNPPSAPPGQTTGVAANEAMVTHYPDQNPDAHQPMITRIATQARSEASSVNGKLVAQLRAGVEADKLADHDGFDLVLFTDPTDPTRKLEGWVAPGAFVATGPVRRGDAGPPAPPAAPHDAGTPKPAPSAPAFNGPLDVKKVNGACPGGYASCGAICRHTCRSSADCGPSGAQCAAGFCLGPGASPCSH